jgi:chemotaxis protein CheD
MSPAASAPTSRRSSIKVGLGVIASSSDSGDVLAALGLGSCIGLVLADPGRVAAMAHVMLPDSGAISTPGAPGKYADTAVPALLEEVVRLGGRKDKLVAKMAGGAQMFAAGTGGGQLNIGVRNAVAVRTALPAAGVRLRAADTGGTLGRTLEVEVGSGRVTVRTVGGERAEL